jgi:hypothetical protein
MSVRFRSVHQREESVADSVPEIQDPAGAAPEAAGQRGVGTNCFVGLEQARQLGVVVFQVRVLDDEHIPVTAFLLVHDEPVDEPVVQKISQDVPGTIGRAIVDHDHLQLQGHPK